MELLLFTLPFLLVAAAYLVPVTDAGKKSAGLPVFGPFCGCKR